MAEYFQTPSHKSCRRRRLGNCGVFYTLCYKSSLTRLWRSNMWPQNMARIGIGVTNVFIEAGRKLWGKRPHICAPFFNYTK